jgi:hypothetical protein
MKTETNCFDLVDEKEEEEDVKDTEVEADFLMREIEEEERGGGNVSDSSTLCHPSSSTQRPFLLSKRMTRRNEEKEGQLLEKEKYIKINEEEGQKIIESSKTSKKLTPLDLLDQMMNLGESPFFGGDETSSFLAAGCSKQHSLEPSISSATDISLNQQFQTRPVLEPEVITLVGFVL